MWKLTFLLTIVILTCKLPEGSYRETVTCFGSGGHHRSPYSKKEVLSMNEILQELIILKGLLLQGIPENELWVLKLCAVLMPFFLYSLCVSFPMNHVVRQVLRENTKLPEKRIRTLAEAYTFPYVYFWGFYPLKFFLFLVNKLRKGGKKHD